MLVVFVVVVVVVVIIVVIVVSVRFISKDRLSLYFLRVVKRRLKGIRDKGRKALLGILQNHDT